MSRGRGDRPLLDPAELSHRLDGVARVAVIADDNASWALSRRLPKLSAYGGAVRIYFPDAHETDPWQQHPLIKVDPLCPQAAAAHVTARIRVAAGLSGEVPAPAPPVPAPRTVTETVEPSQPRQPDLQVPRLEAQLADRERVLADKERLLREKDETIADLRRQVQKLGKQLRAVERTGGGDEDGSVVVFADAERQFRHEVDVHWLHTVAEPDRDQAPLARYSVGRDWTASLEAMELVTRRKILDVVVEVLTGRAADSAVRRLRRMRTSDGGGTAVRIRPDGAVAWRCDIKQGTASAPRLMYWRCSDGTIELGRVAAHDDMMLR